MMWDGAQVANVEVVVGSRAGVTEIAFGGRLLCAAAPFDMGFMALGFGRCVASAKWRIKNRRAIP